MKHLSRKHILVLVLLIVVMVIAVVSVLSVGKDNNSSNNHLTISVVGNEKLIRIKSSIDGELGSFKAGTISINLSKSVHTLTISGDNFITYVTKVDLTEGGKSISVNLKDDSEVQKIASKYSRNAFPLSEKDCSFFADNTWAICNIKYTDFSEKNVFMLKDGSWIFIAGGTYITSQDLEGTGAPQELIYYLDINN